MLKTIRKHAALFALFCLIFINAQAQSGSDWLENTMFQSGKINVVVAVVAILFIILFVYLFRIDRKLKKIEEKEKI